MRRHNSNVNHWRLHIPKCQWFLAIAQFKCQPLKTACSQMLIILSAFAIGEWVLNCSKFNQITHSGCMIITPIPDEKMTQMWCKYFQTPHKHATNCSYSILNQIFLFMNKMWKVLPIYSRMYFLHSGFIPQWSISFSASGIKINGKWSEEWWIWHPSVINHFLIYTFLQVACWRQKGVLSSVLAGKRGWFARTFHAFAMDSLVAITI